MIQKYELKKKLIHETDFRWVIPNLGYMTSGCKYSRKGKHNTNSLLLPPIKLHNSIVTRKWHSDMTKEIKQMNFFFSFLIWEPIKRESGEKENGINKERIPETRSTPRLSISPSVSVQYLSFRVLHPIFLPYLSIYLQPKQIKPKYVNFHKISTNTRGRALKDINFP